MSVYVSIGRNVGPAPMSQKSWDEFIARVYIAVSSFCGPVVSVTKGDGSYDGSREESATVIGSGDPNKYNRECLEMALGHLCREYRQDCIALTVATPFFVTPKD
jgi:hypothetical protein